jgi:hypothetical protein
MASDPDCPEVVAEMANEQEAALAVAYLESLGITAHPWGIGAEHVAYLQVAVRRADAARARAALAEFDSRRLPNEGRRNST